MKPINEMLILCRFLCVCVSICWFGAMVFCNDFYEPKHINISTIQKWLCQIYSFWCSLCMLACGSFVFRLVWHYFILLLLYIYCRLRVNVWFHFWFVHFSLILFLQLLLFAFVSCILWFIASVFPFSACAFVRICVVRFCVLFWIRLFEGYVWFVTWNGSKPTLSPFSHFETTTKCLLFNYNRRCIHPFNLAEIVNDICYTNQLAC